MILRPIQSADNPAMAKIIRTVMTEYGAVGPGYSINDPEVDTMYESYAGDRAVFYVVEEADGTIIGGAGISQLEGGDPDVCELKKMYYLPVARGRGLGAKMLQKCIDAARQMGFRICYLETLERMPEAQRLYRKFGFEQLDGPMGNTGHGSCDRYYALTL